MRLYSFTCSWLSGLQKGLQTAHMVAEMSRLTQDPLTQGKAQIFRIWAEQHKTLIILEGGTQSDIEYLHNFLKQSVMPTAIFYEDETSLAGAATACGIIVSETFYSMASLVREKGWEDPEVQRFKENASVWELQLLTILVDHSLAR